MGTEGLRELGTMNFPSSNLTFCVISASDVQ